MPFSKLGLSDKVLAAVTAAGYPSSHPDPRTSDPPRARPARRARHRADRHRQDRSLRAADAHHAGKGPRAGAHAAHADPGADPRTRRAGRGKLRQVRQEPQAQCRPHHRRRFVRRPGQQADARRRRADRDAGPPARSFRARTAADVRRRAARHRRSRPHARHGLHPRHRAHLQARAVHAPDAVLHRHHAAGDPAHHRAVPAQSGEGRGVEARHHRRLRSCSNW